MSISRGQFDKGIAEAARMKNSLDEVKVVSKKKFEELALHVIAAGDMKNISVIAALSDNPYKPFDVAVKEGGGVKILFRVPSIMKRDGAKFKNYEKLDDLMRYEGDSPVVNQRRLQILSQVSGTSDREMDVIEELKEWAPIAKFYKIPIFGGLINAKGEIQIKEKNSQEDISTEVINMDDFDMGEFI